MGLLAMAGRLVALLFPIAIAMVHF